SSSQSRINRSGSENGNGSSRIDRTTLKIAVFAPIASASVQTAMAVKPGRPRISRAAKRRSRQNVVIVPAIALYSGARDGDDLAGRTMRPCRSASSALARAIAAASPQPSAFAARHASCTCCATSLTTSSLGKARAHSRRTSARKSGMPQPRDADERGDEGVPGRAALGEDAASFGRDVVVTAPPLARFLHPATLDQPPPLEPVQQRIERRGMELEDAVGPLLDQLGDLVPMAGALLEEGEDEHLSAALP